jgi:hypothetical protein
VFEFARREHRVSAVGNPAVVLEKLIITELAKKFSTFIESEVSLLC